MSVQAGTPVRSCVCMRFNYPGSGVLTMILVFGCNGVKTGCVFE